MSKPSRKRHPEGQPRFRRRYTSVTVTGLYGRRSDTVSQDAPLSPKGALEYRWLVLGLVALGVAALIFLGH